MRRLVAVPVLLLSVLTIPVPAQDAEETADAPLEQSGTLIPSSAVEVELWLDAYQGELLMLEVLPHGTFVNKGDVIARLDLEPIDRMIHDAQLELESTEISHQNTVARADIEAGRAASTLAATQRALHNAKRSLEGWEKYELAFNERSSALSATYTQHGIDDATDELNQLEAMYRDDELTDATEEIVLQRSRRNLARSKTSQKLSQDRRDYEKEYNVAMQSEQKRQAVVDAEENLDRLQRTQELDRRSTDDGVRRSKDRLAKARQKVDELTADRGRFEIRAPSSGLLLHGGVDSYRPGKVAPRHERGSSARQRTALFTVAEADRLELALSVPESKLDHVHDGMAVTVTPACAEDRQIVGRLSLDRFPSPASASKPENTYDATVEFDQKLTGLVPGMRAKAVFDTEDAAAPAAGN